MLALVRDLLAFTYGDEQHCHAMVGCKLWAPTWQKQVGCAAEAG